MTPKRWIRHALGLAAIGLATVAVVPPSLPGAPSVGAISGSLGAGGEFHTTTSARIFDTRASSPINDPAPGPKPTGVAVNVPVLGRGGVPANPADVLAVAATVTIVGPTQPGYAEVYPKGFRPDPPTSLINFAKGVNVPNMVILGVGQDGAVTVLPQTAAGGTVHILVDVFGWISKSAYTDTGDTGARLIALDPYRPLDTRAAAPVGPGQSISMKVRGSGGLIPDDPTVTGVVINLTAVNNLPSSQDTFVSALADPLAPGQPPKTSTTNVSKGLIKANLAVVPVGADGNIHLYNSAGNVNLLADVFGYLRSGLPESTYEGRIIPLESPFRSFDTRQVEFGQVPLGFGSQEDWSFWCFADSVTVDDGPDPDTAPDKVGRQSALLGNVTGTQFDRLAPHLPNDTFLTIFPTDVNPRPNTSNINMYPALDIPNMALVTYGSGHPEGAPDGDPYMIRAYNENGSLHYLLDVFAVVLADGPAPVPPPGYCDSGT